LATRREEAARAAGLEGVMGNILHVKTAFALILLSKPLPKSPNFVPNNLHSEVEMCFRAKKQKSFLLRGLCQARGGSFQ
jgi:hypothetical protein